MLHQEADFIRNGVLQDLFAIRRQLELSCHPQSDAKMFSYNNHLAELKRIYTLLENCSNRLAGPYLQDSLPLALQHIVQPWLEKIHLKTEFPAAWESEPVEQTRLLTLLTDSLCRHLATASPKPHRCNMTLQSQGAFKKLTFHAQYEDFLASSLIDQASRQLKPFLETFHIFTQGDYSQDFQPYSLTWVLCWNTQLHDHS